jgi:hypothetical protein
MLFLRGDVFRDRCDLRLADRERSVALLPLEIAWTTVRLYPDRAFAFDVTDQSANEDLFAERDEQMNVIRCSAGCDELAALFVDNSIDVGVEAWFKGIGDQGLPILCGEDDVEEDLGERLRHPVFVPFRDGGGMITRS